MMKRQSYCFALVAASIATSASAQMDFDCDTPPDHFSTLHAVVAGKSSVTGTLSLVEMRGKSGAFAGIQLLRGDGKRGVGFQLKSSNGKASDFDVMLVTRNENEDTFSKIGEASLGRPVPFKFSVSETGAIALSVGGKDYPEKFLPFTVGKATALCFSGDFKFKDVKLGE